MSLSVHLNGGSEGGVQIANADARANEAAVKRNKIVGLMRITSESTFIFIRVPARHCRGRSARGGGSAGSSRRNYTKQTVKCKADRLRIRIQTVCGKRDGEREKECIDKGETACLGR